jgi:hypothetical protein
MSFNSQKPDLYDHERITFIRRVINAQWHAKFGLLFFIHPACISDRGRCQKKTSYNLKHFVYFQLGAFNDSGKENQ